MTDYRTRYCRTLTVALLVALTLPAAQATEPARALIAVTTSEHPTTALARLELHGERASLGPTLQLRRAEYYLAYGMSEAGEAALASVAWDELPTDQHNRAKLYLAELRFDRGHLREALAALDQIPRRSSGAVAVRAALLRAHILMQQGRYAEAAAVLAPLRSEGSAAIAYNLGVAHLLGGQRRDGERTLARLAESTPATEPDASFADLARTTLGFHYLSLGRPQEAERAFLRVRADSPVANRALLGLGWARLGGGGGDPLASEAALASLQPLSDTDAHDLAQLEALIAVPYTYALRGNDRQAAAGYRHAIERLEAERSRLRALRTSLEQNGISSLLQPQPGGHGWLRSTPLPANHALARRLGRALASPEFVETVKGWQDSTELAGRLAERASNLPRTQHELRQRMQALQARAEKLAMAHERQVLDMARNRLEQRDDRIEAMLSEARLGLAAAHDRLGTEP